jgi:hypothetical protein
MNKELLKKYWYIPVVILSILFLVYKNVDFRIRTDTASFFFNCVLNGLTKVKHTDNVAVEAVILLCRRAEALKLDKWITQRGRVFEYYSR